MKISCSYCGKEFNQRPSKMKKRNYCCKDCRHRDSVATLVCDTCGKTFERLKCSTFKHSFCSRECAKPFLSRKFAELNRSLNPDRMTANVRAKLREAKLGKGCGKAYTKTFGRHTHRIVAEQMLGRPLKSGEVVHHIDGDKRNNHPLNLMVFPSQQKHALWHKNESLDPSKNYE